MSGGCSGPPASAQPDYGRIHQELRRKSATWTLLREKYQAEFAGRQAYRYTQFCEHYKAFTKRLKSPMRQIRRADEKLFAGFAGAHVGADHRAPRTRIRARHARPELHVRVRDTLAQTMEDWVGGIARALTFYGGVPRLIVVDNPCATIADPDRCETPAGDAVLDFARHDGTSFLPARVFCPPDKPKAEAAIQRVERSIIVHLLHHRLASVQSVDHATFPKSAVAFAEIRSRPNIL